MISKTFHTALFDDLRTLLDSNDDCDVVIKCSDGQNRHAHSIILRARCQYFRIALSSKWGKKDENEGLYVIQRYGTNVDVLDVILRYLYTGEVYMNANIDLFDLLSTADELALDELFFHIQDFTIENGIDYFNQVNKVLNLIFNLQAATKLQEYCLNLVSVNPKLVFESDGFEALDEDVLIAILQMDDIVMEEVVIWNCVIKWGIANTECIQDDKPDEWSEADFNALGNTLSNILPLIRYSDFSHAQFTERLQPFSQMFHSPLRENILTYFKNQPVPNSTQEASQLAPPRFSWVSRLITRQHASLITSWIEDDSATAYKLRLLYRATDMGFRLPIKDWCSSMFVVANIRETNEIIGGYSSRGDIGKNDSFLFAFKDKRDVSTAKVSRVLLESFSCINIEKLLRGLKGGFFWLGGGELRIGGMVDPKSGYYKKNAYDERLREFEGTFKIDEYEVFEVIRV
ncbi:6522_t:CDS:2 [Paraglomus brasilianum]|uniref:6522_t:CDS:1 n=1 Tax=Paraglomus brasilianum TaxID=144538 RepID=A0A9N9GMF9_9GLOM|nr:6522_t:CDS:2 [Paraglomus brasilianum]